MTNWAPIAAAALLVLVMAALRVLGVFPRRPIPNPIETIRRSLPPGAVPDNQDERKWRSLLTQLRDLGFFDQVPAEQVDETMGRCLEARWMFDDAVGRTAFADVEHLSEGGFIDWLTNEGAVLLARRGLTMPDVRQTEDDDRYVVHVGSRVYVVHQSTDSGDERWIRAAETCLQIMNDRFSEAKVEDRLYWLHGGEDGVVGLMTPSMFALITRARLINSSSWPYAA